MRLQFGRFHVKNVSDSAESSSGAALQAVPATWLSGNLENDYFFVRLRKKFAVFLGNNVSGKTGSVKQHEVFVW